MGKIMTEQRVDGVLYEIADKLCRTGSPLNYGSPEPEGITSCNNIEKNSIYFVSVNGGVKQIPDFPMDLPGWLITVFNESQRLQIAFGWDTQGNVKYRTMKHGAWTGWLKITSTEHNVGLRKLMENIDSGLLMHQIVSGETYNGGTIEYDYNKGMYHITGTVTGGRFFSNLIYEDFGLCGLRTGETYHLYLRTENIIEPAGNIKIQVFENYNSKTAEWQHTRTIPAETLVEFTVPEETVGLLFRVYCESNGEYDSYVALECTRANSLTPSMTTAIFKNAIKEITLSDYSGSCDDVTENGVYFNSVSGSDKTFVDFPISGPGYLFHCNFAGNSIQLAAGWQRNVMLMRSCKFGQEWNEWGAIGGENSYLPGCDLDTIFTPGFYLLINSEVYENLPVNVNAGFLRVSKSKNWGMQTFYHLTDGRSWVRTFTNGSIHTEWTEAQGGSGNTYNITQQINRDEIQNTYSISTSPVITTDSNGWLQAIDSESTPEAEATDMTGPIMSMLNANGYCHLGPGVFYVSGNIDMPNGSVIEGCGDRTIIRLLSSVQSGYILRIMQYNTVKNLHFSGGTDLPENLYTDGTNMGSRHGIYMIANADGKESAQPGTLQCMITGCWFDNFDGSAFYAHNTGGGIHNSVIFSDSHIQHCRVGLNIDYYNEYAKYSNLVIYQCYYACINNGGNNIFTGCTFHGVVGWLTDNSGEDKSNNQHGSCIGCIFNHIDNMNHPDVLGNGTAVHIINGVAGFIFTGCQLWYGNVKIDNSSGVQFSDCLFGNNGISIEVTGAYPAFFFNNIFWTVPILDVVTTCKFEGNYLRTGSKVEPR